MVASATQGLRDISTGYIDEFNHSGLDPIQAGILAGAQRRSSADAVSIGDAAGAQSDAAFANVEGGLARQEAGLGAPMTARDQASQTRRLGLAKVLANVDSRNRAMQADMANRNAVRTNAFGLRDVIDKAATDAFSSGSQLELSRQAEQQQRMADYRANKAKTIGTIAGMAANFIPVVGPFIAPMVSGAVTNKLSGP
jgi:hypothetical protein